MNICLFGGSFDPVHSGHLSIAEAAQACANLDKVIFLPAACSPFKTGKQTMFAGEERMEMLRLATQDYPWAEISDLDLALPPPSWSWRLVEHYRQQYPHDKLLWLMGTDQWEQLHRWARYDYLIEQLTFIVYHRSAPPQPRENAQAIFISGNNPASSSTIRDALLSGGPVPATWWPAAVEKQARFYLQQR